MWPSYVSILFFTFYMMCPNRKHIVESMSIFNDEQNFWSRIFSFEIANVQQMADLAMNPAIINNKTLIELYSEANEIVNITGADSVLLEIESKNRTNKTNSLKVLAVTNPNVPTHEDLLKKFHLYFVNLTESPISGSSSIANSISSLSFTQPTFWQIFVDLIRNQANAILGALMIPINVSANAILKSTQTHAEYVMSGSSVGSVISAPVILKAISIPNIVSQRITDFTSHQVNNIESLSQQTKLMADNGIQSVANGLNNGTNLVSDMADQYVIRPIGAFTGFNLDRAGTHITQIGQSFSNTGLNIHLFGERIGSGAVKVVSAGATAVAWGLDDTVNFSEKKNTSNIS